jgi:hypothetical protein
MRNFMVGWMLRLTITVAATGLAWGWKGAAAGLALFMLATEVRSS